jgi:hypothetical protein
VREAGGASSKGICACGAMKDCDEEVEDEEEKHLRRVAG